MSTLKPIRTALVSVYKQKTVSPPIVEKLHSLGVELLSTGGSRTYIESLGIPCKAVEDLTGYPSILGGRVKTLHPKVSAAFSPAATMKATAPSSHNTKFPQSTS